jgi:DNA primase
MAEKLIDTKEILSKVNIVNVVKNYMPLTKKGRNYMGLCPFHNDSNPSMVVSEEKQIFKCFVCGTGGNVINFVQKKENISYRDALLKVAEMAGYNVSKYKNQSNDRFYKEKACFNDLNEYYTSVIELENNKHALEYCEKRGLTSEIRRKFHIGFAPKDGAKTIEYLKSILNEDSEQKYSLKLMQDYGICSYKQGSYRDIYEGRLTFGIANTYGEIVGFSARYLEKDPNNEIPKYINTKETQIFHKSDILYNFYNAKNHTRDSNYLYIVEGFMDVIALHKIGIQAVVGLMGTALSEKHISMLKNEGVEIRLCLDNDKAGQTNTLSIVKKFNKAGIKFRVVKRHDLEKDADEILNNHGKDVLLETINNLITQQDFIIDYYKHHHNLTDDTEKKTFIRQVFNEIINLDDNLEIEGYCSKLASITGYSKLNIEKEYYRLKEKVEIKQNNVPAEDDNVVNPPYSDEKLFSYQTREHITTSNSLKRINKLEHLFIKLMLNDDEISKLCVNDKNINFFNPVFSEIHFYIREFLSNISTFNLVDFIDYVSGTAKDPTNVVYEITKISLEDPINVSKSTIDRYTKELNYEKNLYLLDKKINNELNDTKKSELMEQKRDLIKNKRKYFNG